MKPSRRKKLLVLVGIEALVITAGMALAQLHDASSAIAANSADQAAKATASIEAVERARFAAFVAADTAAMELLLADDLVYCHSTGQCQTKAEVLAEIGGHKRVYKVLDLLELKPQTVASGVIVIHGRARILAEMDDKKAEFVGIYTDVYVLRSGRWQLVSWQSTPLPAGPPAATR